MSIEDKIKYIQEAGLGFVSSGYYYDISYDAVVFELFNKGLINKKKMVKLKLIGEKTNFASRYWLGEDLNSYSILFVNLIYEILNAK